MSPDIIIEVNIFAKSIMLGVLFAFTYDFFRIMRRIRSRNIFLISVEDIIFWIISAVITCVFLYKVNGGIIRGYILSGIAIGMILYELSIGRLAVRYLTICIKYFVDKANKILTKLWKIVLWGLKKITKPFRIVFNTLSGKAKKKYLLYRSKKRGADSERKKCKRRKRKKKNKKQIRQERI